MSYLWARIRLWAHGMRWLATMQPHRELIWSQGPYWKVVSGLAVTRVACADCGEIFWESAEPEWADRDFQHAGGDVICSVCGKKYYAHPMDKTVIGWGERPFLYLTCLGKRVKL